MRMLAEGARSRASSAAPCAGRAARGHARGSPRPRRARRRRRRVADIGVAVLEEARARRRWRRKSRRCTASRRSADSRRRAPWRCSAMSGATPSCLAGEQRAGPAHAAHHLVEDQQHAVAVADLADAPEIARRRRHRAGGGADYRLGDESHHGLGPQPQNLVLQRLSGPLAVVLKALVVAFQPVFVARVDMGDVEQQRPELRPPPLIAAGAERADGVAVIALLARDQASRCGSPILDPVLPGELDRRLVASDPPETR
jgi:hypothetical protein